MIFSRSVVPKFLLRLQLAGWTFNAISVKLVCLISKAVIVSSYGEPVLCQATAAAPWLPPAGLFTLMLSA